VPVHDPGALADAIAVLAADPGERRRLGGNARAKAERDFDQRRCVDITLRTYRRLLAQAGRPMPRPVAP
jgi:glycosyltransferase involved in cell wall biosynthesis